MTITICGSMLFSQKMLAVQNELEAAGHTCHMPMQVREYAAGMRKTTGSEDASNKIKHGVIKDHYERIKKSDAILVLNYDKNGIPNYIGGNTFLEIGFAHVLNKKVYFLQPLPDNEIYRAEIVAMQPVAINGDLSKIK